MNFGQGKVREFHFRLRVGTLNTIYMKFAQFAKDKTIFRDIHVTTVKPVLSSHSKRPKLVFKTDYRLMQVKSIAECSRAFYNTFNLH